MNLYVSDTYGKGGSRCSAPFMLISQADFILAERPLLNFSAQLRSLLNRICVRSLLEAGVPPVYAVEGWLGPINGVQDFALGAGAVEVKTTIAAAGFVATIASLEQMDDSSRQPLYLAGIRICQDASGMSLSEVIEDTRALLREDATARHSFNIKLLHAGYLDALSDHYKRSFMLVCMQIFPVVEGFPRLTRAAVPRHVIQARYELDIDSIDTITVPLHVALEQLGVK